jgi:leader peptidase (prepilin peptidase)/N-methyltransferase
MLVFVAVLFGLVVGSFLNVVIHRVPRRESVVWPASHCPHCAEPIRPRDNVPLISYVLLRGRCRNCKEPISARYPAVEATTGLLFGAAAY